MSLPSHFHGWDVKRAATFRVLVHLWHFADNEKAKAWCFRTDVELIESCNLRDDRHLRECLRDLRLAKVVMRETGPDGRPGFRLYNRAPFSGGTPPAELRRRKAAALPAESRRLAGGTPPPHLLESRRAEEPSEIAKPFALELDASTPKPRSARRHRKADNPAAPETTVAQVFEALHTARVQIAEREGIRMRRIEPNPMTRIELATRMVEGWTVAQIIESFEARGRVGDRTDHMFLTQHTFHMKTLNRGMTISPDDQPPIKPFVDENGLRDID